MDRKQRLIDLSRDATGDDGIIVAGDFSPKGTYWKSMTGAVAGGLVGGQAGTEAASVGAAAGGTLGTYAQSSQLPPVVILAATEQTLYLLSPENRHNGAANPGPLVPFGELALEHLSFEFKQRLMTRTVEITDESTGRQFGFEGERLGVHHMNDLLDFLVHHGTTAEPEDEAKA
ncbi:hypothetical protein [Agromyces salentinus]|uniref:Uncharacterized protein n=1 Tax=Agromyces salentinus TaxID=269421 RepID=A0ABP4YRT7_9MICO|nr:hypothetical protein [Agromyces salentinus]